MRVSSSLRGLGLTKGDVVGVLLPNCIEFPLVVQVSCFFLFFQNLPLLLTFNSFPGRSSLWPHYHSHESSLHPSRLTRSLCVIRVLCLNYRRQFRLVTSMRHKKYKLYKRYKCRGWHPCHDQIRNWLLSEISRQLKASKATVLVTHTR